MTLIDDWQEFKQNRAIYDRDHFASLLKQYRSPHEISQICDGLRGGAEIARRIIRLYEENDLGGFGYVIPLAENAARIDECEVLVRSILADYFQFLQLKDESELLDELKGIVPERSDPPSIKYASEDLSILEFGIWDVIDDDYLSKGVDNPAVFSAFTEAVFQLTMHKSVTRYILSPHVSSDINYELHYELFHKCGILIVTNESALFSLIFPPQ